MAKRFDLSQYIEKTESKMDTRPRLAEVELHLIDAAPGNFYSMDGIDSLADNIALNGLLDPPHVREANGRYVVVSGHRRREALRRLVERGEMGPHDLVRVFIDPPVDVGDAKDADAARIALQQLRLIYANADNRQYTPADKAREVRELTEIFAELKRLGYSFPMKTRSMVAEAAKISESRAARLSVIEKNLTTPGLRAAFTDGRLGENAAYEISRRGADVIGRVEELPMGMVCEMTIERLGAVLEGLEKKAAEDAAELKAYNAGVKAMGEAQPAAKAAEIPTRSSFDAEAYIQERTAEDLRYLDMMAAKLDELISDGFSCVIHNRREGIDMFKARLRTVYTGGGAVNYAGYGNGLELRRLRGGNILRSWTEAYDALCTAAINRLGKNIAWDGEDPEAEDDGDDGPPRASRTGIASHANPRVALAPTDAPEWMTGEPPRIGRYFCKVDMGDSKPHENRCWWGNDGWSCYGANLKANGWRVVGWWPLPKEG